MARLDVTRLRGGTDLVLDCQANTLRDLGNRFVVPLRPIEQWPKPVRRLNPVFVIEQRSWVMLTQFAAAVSVRDLGAFVMSLENEEFAIGNALDLLIYGI